MDRYKQSAVTRLANKAVHRENRHVLQPRGLHRCPHCRNIKPYTTLYFNSDLLLTELGHARSRAGLLSICRACGAEQSRRRRAAQSPQEYEDGLAARREEYNNATLRSKDEDAQNRLLVLRHNYEVLMPQGKAMCTACMVVKELNAYYFYPRRASHSGFNTQCRVCTNARHRARRANPARQRRTESNTTYVRESKREKTMAETPPLKLVRRHIRTLRALLDGPLGKSGYLGLMGKANSAPSTTRRAMKELEAHGMIEWDQGKADEVWGDAFRITDAGREALGE